MEYRNLTKNDSHDISSLVISTGCLLKETDFTDDGWEFFVKVNQPIEIENRFNGGFISFGSFQNNELIGLITIKNNSHITQLFVKKDHQGKGISSRLWEMAKKVTGEIQENKEYTVFSSSVAIPVYESFGFQVIEAPQERNGIYYRSMKLQSDRRI